jgi:hypothetical protein
MNEIQSDQVKIQPIPNEKWQASASRFVATCETHLWGKSGMKAQRYLHSLGLKDETLHRYHIGFNPKECFESLENWGLPGEQNSNGNPKKVWLPRGIVVPYFVEEVIFSIKIRRYLSKEQKNNGEQPDRFTKGGLLGLFGAENLSDAKIAVLTDDEFDAMLLDQEASDIVRSASFGKATKGIGAPEWASWGRYLLPLLYILVPYTHEEETIIITDSLPFFSHRTYHAYLPDRPEIKVITDLRKAGVDPREWLIQTIANLGLFEGMPNNISRNSLVRTVSKSDMSLEMASSKVSNSAADEDSDGDINQINKSRIINLNELWLVDPKIKPPVPCYCCNSDDYWQRPDGGWVCKICHP